MAKAKIFVFCNGCQPQWHSFDERIAAKKKAAQL